MRGLWQLLAAAGLLLSGEPAASEPSSEPPAAEVDLDLPGLKFYLFNPVREFDWVSQCVLDQVGGEAALDAKLHPRFAQHMSQYWLEKRLKEHANHVESPADADISVITTPVFMSWVAAQSGCGTMTSHYQRMQTLANRLRMSKAYQSKKPILMPHTWWQCETVWGKAFFDVMNARNMILGTSDTFFCADLYFTRRVILPYVAHGGLDAFAQRDVASQRQWSFFFHGSVARTREGQYRGRLLKSLDLLVDGTNFRAVGNTATMTTDTVLWLVQSTARDVKHARYCLVLPGDSTTSRRLFDALAAGCVPVLFDVAGATQSAGLASGYRPAGMYQDWKSDKYRQNLPFKRTLKWDSMVLFMDTVQAAVSNLHGTALRLQLLDNQDRMKRSKVGQQGYRDALSYRQGSGLVNCMLRELEGTLEQPAYPWGLLEHKPAGDAARAHAAEELEATRRAGGTEPSNLTEPLNGTLNGTGFLSGLEDTEALLNRTPPVPTNLSLSGAARDQVVFYKAASGAAPFAEPKTVWVVGFGRSGTSLLQELVLEAAMESGHSVFGAFEPCHPEDRYFGVELGFDLSRTKQCLQQVLRCDFTNVVLRFQHHTNDLSPGYGLMSQRCRQADVRVFKTIHPSPTTGPGLDVAPPGTKVLRLARDPRAVFSSMSGLPGFSERLRTTGVGGFTQTLCQQMHRWQQDLPRGLKQVRFEDLVTEAVPVLTGLLAFVGLPLTPGFAQYLSTVFSPPTCPPARMPEYSTCRTAAQTQDTLTKWRRLLSAEEKQRFASTTCESTLKEYDYI